MPKKLLNQKIDRLINSFISLGPALIVLAVATQLGCSEVVQALVFFCTLFAFILITKKFKFNILK